MQDSIMTDEEKIIDLWKKITGVIIIETSSNDFIMVAECNDNIDFGKK